MKNLLTKLKVLAELILAVSLIYAAIVYTFSSIFINVLIIIVSLFILAQALGNIDNMNGYNQKNTNAGFPGSPGFPVNHHHNNHYPNAVFPATGFPDNDDDDNSDDTDDLNDNDYPEIPE